MKGREDFDWSVYNLLTFDPGMQPQGRFGDPIVVYLDDKPVARGRVGCPDTLEPIEEQS